MCKIKCNKVIWALCIQFIVCSFDHLLSFFSFLIWAHTTLKQLKQRSVVYFGLHLYISYGQNCNVFRCLFFCVCVVYVFVFLRTKPTSKNHIFADCLRFAVSMVHLGAAMQQTGIAHNLKIAFFCRHNASERAHQI